MAELAKKIADASSHMKVEWDPLELARIEKEVERRIRRQRGYRRSLWAGAAAAILTVAFLTGSLLQRRTPTPTDVVSIVVGEGHALSVSGASSVLAASRSTEQLTELRLQVGKAQVELAPLVGHTVRIDAAPVVLEGQDSKLFVERRAGSTFVAIKQGHMRVLFAGQVIELHAGEQRVFRQPEPGNVGSPAIEAPQSPPDAGIKSLGDSAVEREARSVGPSLEGRRKAWKRLAEQGDFARAYRALEAAGSAAVRDEPAELLLSADTARLSGHPQKAIAPLERILRKHAGDPRAALAAFTLGRVQLEELGRPHEAAHAFARARALQPTAPLAQDALAREVEARSRVGEVELARQLAEEYVRRYPNGTKIRSVRRFGGLP